MIPSSDATEITARQTPPAARQAKLLAQLRELRAEVQADGARIVEGWESHILRPGFRERALNLAHYIVLRRRELRPLQEELMLLGLSSMGRLEGRVLPSLDAVTAALAAMVRDPHPEAFPSAVEMFQGRELTRINAEIALGPAVGARRVRLMVTLPLEVGESHELATELLDGGADLVRINCAHGDPTLWLAMIGNVRSAAHESGRDVRILMDLAGPKCRTSSVRVAKGRKRLRVGDEFLLVKADFAAAEEFPAQAQCTLPSVFEDLCSGAPVWLDEGRVSGSVAAVVPEGALVRVEAAPPRGLRLKPDKGLNFPGTDLGVPALTEKDLADLDFVAREADLVGYSFVQDAADIARLQAELEARVGRARAQRIGVVAKIETARAVRNLPEIIVQGAGRQPFAVMIARGDLGVEIGFARLAEIQEEILWLCEAAHVPVIWATGVLNGLIKDGQASRGEMTDAAMSARAECVMLNKGPHVAEALRCLDGLFVRMGAHLEKKTPRLRALKSW